MSIFVKAIDKNVLNKFFRSKERIEYRKFILQYLIKFINKLPTQQEIRTIPVNPFKQFKSFVQYNLDLLKETDVTNCLLREYKKRFEWNEESSIYCQKHALQKISVNYFLQSKNSVFFGSPSKMKILIMLEKVTSIFIN